MVQLLPWLPRVASRPWDNSLNQAGENVAAWVGSPQGHLPFAPISGLVSC